jgi:DNA replication initiation complex subunit (GINS family)
MRRKGEAANGRQRENITTELEKLAQQQSEMAKREALVGLTPAERGEYEKLGERIRQLFVDMARIHGADAARS